MNNFVMFGSNNNLDQYQAPVNFQRSSHHSGSMGEPLQRDLLLSKTTSIKAPDKLSETKPPNSTSDFWYLQGRGSNPQPRNNEQLVMSNAQDYASTCAYMEDPRQSVNLQDITKPQFLIYSHNPSVKIVEKQAPLGMYQSKQKENASQLSGKSVNKSLKQRRKRKSSHRSDFQSRSSQFQGSNVNNEEVENPNEVFKVKLKKVEKDLKDMDVEDLKFVFEILDDKKQGVINKDNFKFTNLPLKTMNSMEPFIKEMLVRDGSLDFNQYIDLIQNLIGKDD
jgi:hypothetical protein